METGSNINVEKVEVNNCDIRPSLVSSGIHTLGSNVVQMACYFLTAVFIARALGPESKGVYDLCIATAGLIGSVIGLSMPGGITLVVAEGGINLRYTIRDLLVLMAIQGGIIALVLAYLGRVHVASYFFPSPTLLASGLASVFITLIALSDMVRSNLRSILAGQRDFFRANYSDLAKHGLGLIGFLIVWLLIVCLGIKSSMARISFLLGGGILAGSLAGVWTWRLIRLYPEKNENSGLRRILRYSVLVVISNSIQFLNYRASVFMINAYVDAQAVGLFQTASFLAQALWLVPNAASGILMPVVAAEEGDLGSRHRTIERTLMSGRLVLWFTVLVALIVGGGAFVVIPLIFGQNYKASIIPLLLLLPGATLYALTHVLAGHIAGTGKININIAISTFGLIVMLFCGYALIPRMGINGMAIATSISYILTSLLTMFVFSRLVKTSFCKTFMPTLEDGKILFNVFERLFVNMKKNMRGHKP